MSVAKMPGMPSLPPLNFQSSSSASGHVQAGFDNSGFVVNFGPGNTVGGGLPQWVLIAAAFGAALWLIKKGKG